MILITDGMICRSKSVFKSVSGIGANEVEVQLIMEEGVHAHCSELLKLANSKVGLPIRFFPHFPRLLHTVQIKEVPIPGALWELLEGFL